MTDQIKDIQKYYDKRMALLTKLIISIPNDMDRIGVLLVENKALRDAVARQNKELEDWREK